MRTVKPLGSKILVRQVTRTLESNIIIPDSAQRVLSEAVVISTGPGYRMATANARKFIDHGTEFFSPLQVKKGDRIVYDTQAQNLHHIDLIDGEGRFIIMDENAIIAKLEEIPNE